MKDAYSINILINSLDKMILDEKYKEDNEMNDSVKQTAEYYYSMYEQYQNITKEQFLENNGFKSEKEFLEYLKLDYRRNLYYDEYVKNLINEKDIEKYYKDEVFGDVNSKHILVKPDTTSDMSEDEIATKKSEAKKLFAGKKVKVKLKRKADGKEYEAHASYNKETNKIEITL